MKRSAILRKYRQPVKLHSAGALSYSCTCAGFVVMCGTFIGCQWPLTTALLFRQHLSPLMTIFYSGLGVARRVQPAKLPKSLPRALLLCRHPLTRNARSPPRRWPTCPACPAKWTSCCNSMVQRQRGRAQRQRSRRRAARARRVAGDAALGRALERSRRGR